MDLISCGLFYASLRAKASRARGPKHSRATCTARRDTQVMRQSGEEDRWRFVARCIGLCVGACCRGIASPCRAFVPFARNDALPEGLSYRVIVARLGWPARNKKAPSGGMRIVIKDRQRLTLPGVILVPSALAGLTALFGMGRGDPRRYSHLKFFDDVYDRRPSPPSR